MCMGQQNVLNQQKTNKQMSLEKLSSKLVWKVTSDQELGLQDVGLSFRLTYYSISICVNIETLA